MRTVHPKIAVLSGAAVGLIAGAAVYGVVSTSPNTKQADKVAAVSLAVAPARAPVPAPVPAHCAKGATLERGICIVHVQRVVHEEHVIRIPAAAPAAKPVGQNGQTRPAGRAVRRGGSSLSGASTSPAQAQPPRAPVQAAASQHSEPADAESEKAPTGEGDD